MKKVFVNFKTSGNGQMYKDRPCIQDVVAVYADGTVRTASGDVYKVQKCTTDTYDYVAIG